MTDWNTQSILVRVHTHRHTGTQCVVSFAGQLKVCIYVCAGSYDYLYRMRALDAIRAAGEPCHRWSSTSIFYFLWWNFSKKKNLLPVDLPFHELGGTSAAVTGKRLRTWLLQLRNSDCMFGDSPSSVIDTVLDGYNKARHGAEVSVSSTVHLLTAT